MEKSPKPVLGNQHAEGVSLKCLYINAHSMGNIRNEICVQRLQVYSLIGITEMWWDGSHDWSVALVGYRVFREDRIGIQGR